MDTEVVNESDLRLSIQAIRDTLMERLEALNQEGLGIESDLAEVVDGQVISRAETKILEYEKQELVSVGNKIQNILSLSDDEIARLVGLLRTLRGYLAYSKKVKPYVIFPDSVLIDLIVDRPTTLAALGKVKGFPADGNRVNKWGPAVIAVFGEKPVEDFVVTVDDDGDAIPSVVLKRMSSF